MRTGAEILKEIEQEKERAAAKVAELQERQKENRKLLAQANEQYLTALADAADDAEIAILAEQLEAAERTVKLTDDAIQSLTNGSPRIQALEAERFSLLVFKCEEVKKKATAIHKSLKPHYDALVNGVDELNELYHEWSSYSYSANKILEGLDSAQKEKLGLPIRVTDSNPVVNLLNSLLIERHRAYRMR